MLDEIEMLAQCNKLRKSSNRNRSLSMEEGVTKEELKEQSEDIDEEKLCNICYFSEKDTEIIPCGHSTC